MRIIYLSSLAAIFLASLWISGCGTDDACDSIALQEELDTAASGSTVTLGACTVVGPLQVPAGVTLQGSDAINSRVMAPSGQRAITMLPGTEASAVRSLGVDADGCAGIVVMGEGSAEISDVEVNASTGVGIAVEGVTNFLASNVTVMGPVSMESAATTSPPLPPFSCGSSDIASHGVVLVDVSSADLTNVESGGFGAFGLLAIRSQLTWNGGGAQTNLGAGVEVWGGQANLTNLTISGTTDGSGAIESFGAAFGGGAVINTNELTVQEGDSFGLFHDGTMGAVHENLTVRNQGFAAVWSQTATQLHITGASVLDNNGFAGVATYETTDVSLDGITVSNTQERPRIEGVRTVRAADGLHLVDSLGSIANATLTNNGRVGLLLDLAGGATSRVGLTAIEVSGTGTALGAIAQNGTLAPTWDAEVSRNGDTLANDAAFSSALDIAGAIGPVCVPPIDGVEMSGISSLVDP